MKISYQCSCERYGIRLIKLPMKGTELDYIYCVKNNNIIILWMCQTRNVIFITILVLCSIIQFNINIFSIVCLSDIMRKTKEEYMGRIMGFVSMITNMFQPISQIIYGRGLEYTISEFGKFLIMIAVSILGISLYRKNVIKRDKK